MDAIYEIGGLVEIGEECDTELKLAVEPSYEKKLL